MDDKSGKFQNLYYVHIYTWKFRLSIPYDEFVPILKSASRPHSSTVPLPRHCVKSKFRPREEEMRFHAVGRLRGGPGWTWVDAVDPGAPPGARG